ncbi:MAG: PKD domain-containing protein [Pedobacter sp.]|uniref:PKD domain-containing protein n=1 Tax=Pedobacter sp. TaxID=1411316 RepID=UPI00356400EB
MVRHLLFFTLALFFIQVSEVFSQINIGRVELGPYSPGSSIATTFTLQNTCIKPGNNFELYLVSPDGTEIPGSIGSYNGFYTTYVNGVIPPGTPAGTGYALRIKSTNPVFISGNSIPFEIKTGQIANPIIDSETKPSDNPRTFGLCEVDNNTPNDFEFTNESLTNNVIVDVINESTFPNTISATLTFTSTGDASYKTFNAAKTHYTLFAKAIMPDGSIGTKAYILINNPVVTAFETSGGINVCFPEGKFEYEVGPNIKQNFPGNIYKIDWGDGTVPSEYTYCDIVDQNFRVSHLFNRSSCGLSYTSGAQTFYNAFAVNVGVISPFCNAIGRPLSTPARVITRPINSFDRPEVACLGSVTFNNTSVAGENPIANAPGCAPSTMRYTWFVDGVEVSNDFNLTYNFTTPGIKRIRLESRSVGGVCQAEPIERTICIQNPPKPDFIIPVNRICLIPGTLTPENTSVLDNSCLTAVPIYTWNVTGPSVVAYLNGTDKNSPTPQFKFNQIGRYIISLTIQSGNCEVTSTVQEVIVDSDPIVDLSDEAKICQTGPLTFDPNATITRTIITGSVDNPSPQVDTYIWEVLGPGAYNFVGTSNANSKYPTINFSDYGTYTVKLTFKNSCNTRIETQVINIYESPVPGIIASPNPICYDADINLQGNITNRTAQTRYLWIGNGTFAYPDPSDHLKAVYTPTTAERIAGTAHIRLQVNTGLQAPCAIVEESIDVTITPNNTTTNPLPSRTTTICTEKAVTFIPTSVVPGSNFTWIATNEDGNATGFSLAGNGAINQTITNTSTTQNAVVVYTITPSTATCIGVPFTFTVIVTPKPVIDPITDKTICHNNPSGIVLTSNIPTRFTWTSVPSSTDIQGNTNGTGSTSLIGGKNSFTINEALLNSSFLPGTVTYTIKSYSADDCEGTTTTVIITVDPAVTVAYAGPNERICDTETYQLKGNKANVGTGKWELVSASLGSPQITDDTNFQSTVTGLQTNGVYIFKWVISPTGTCPGTESQVTISVTPKPMVDPVADKTICHSNSAGIVLTSDIPTRFTWTSDASSADITGNTNGTGSTSLIGGKNSFTINEALLNNSFLPGTVTYTIRSYSGDDCEGTPTTVTITVDPAVTVANAGGDERICDTETYQLKGNKANVGTGKWELVSASLGSPQITDDTNFESTVTGLQANGVYIFKWIISPTGACPGTESQVTITVNIPTVPGITTGAQTVCQNDNTGTITLSGNNGSVLGWQMSTDNGATWQDVPGVNTASTYSYTDLSTTTQFRAIVQNEGCTIAYSTSTTISVAPPTTRANAGVDQILCNETSVLLKGNPIASGETGIWTMVSGDPNAVITPGLNSEASVTGLLPGITYIFKWTITGNAPCNPTEDEVTIRNNKPIDLNSLTTSNAIVCNGQQITIVGHLPTGGEEGQYQYIWESQINGSPWEVMTGKTAKDLTIILTTTGITSFRRTVNSGNCTSISNELPITIQPPIGNNNIANNQTICSGLIPMLITGTLPTGGDDHFFYRWESSLDGSNWTSIPNIITPDYQPPALTQTTHYRRIVSTVECSGSLESISNAIIKTVTPNAKAEFTWGLKDTDCFPFTLPIQVVPYPDRNDTYTWHINVDGVIQTTTGPNFPGYTIESSGKSVIVRLVVTSKLGCSTDEMSHTFSTNQAVQASFNVSDDEFCGPFPVNFTNTSLLTAGARFEWDFGNGQFSTAVHPTMTFEPDPSGEDIIYTVTLKAITDCGTSPVTRDILVKAKPKAVFTPDKVEVCSPYKITFINTSPGNTNKYYYDVYGDGSKIIEKDDKSPLEFVYDVTETTVFNVKMTAVNECGTNEKIQTIRVFPQNMIAVLHVKLDEIRGCAPHIVNFENNSTGASRFEFDFGDGSPIQTTFAPGIVPHTYRRSGKFTVTMTAYNICSKITDTKDVEVFAQPQADFEADQTLGCPGLVVKFKNNSVGGLGNSYLWDFGDGNSSSDFEPTHTYTGDQEYYTVKLIATNQLTCKTEVEKPQYIRIVPPPQAAFNVVPSTVISIPNYTFKFEDESTNNPITWEWNFGDGTTSELKNPSHTYLDTGTYRVTLKVTNQQDCHTTTFKDVTIKGVPGYLFVPNSFIPGGEIPELRLFRAKGSGIKTWRFSVFNKWGQIVWETSLLDEGRPAEAWDGTFKGQPMPQGVYYWKIDVEMVNGTEWKGMTYDKTPPKRTGAIHLIR